MTNDLSVERLRERVEAGINWLIEHDPKGRFHLWFSAGLSPLSPMPAHGEDVRIAYSEYVKQRRRWEQMSKDLGRIDPTWGPE